MFKFEPVMSWISNEVQVPVVSRFHWMLHFCPTCSGVPVGVKSAGIATGRSFRTPTSRQGKRSMGGTGGNGEREWSDNDGSRTGNKGTSKHTERETGESQRVFFSFQGVTSRGHGPPPAPSGTLRSEDTHPEDLARTRSSRHDVGVRCLCRREDEESGPGAELSDRAHRDEWGQRCVGASEYRIRNE